MTEISDLNDGPTMPLDEFIEKEKEMSKLFWYLDSGHHQNLLDEAIERMQAAESTIKRVNKHLDDADAFGDEIETDEIRKVLEQTE